MYLLDSNIYINFYDRYYRKDFFPTFWSNFAGILNSSVVIPKIVISENYQDDWFRDWLTNYKDAALMSQKGWANADIADPWLIAIAKSMNYTIVTDEVKNVNLNSTNPSKNAKIPDVCDQLGVRCISMNEFFEEIGLSV